VDRITELCRIRDAIKVLKHSDVLTWEEYKMLAEINGRVRQQLMEVEEDNHTLIR